MEKFIQSIKSQPIYYAIILSSCIVSAAYYIYTVKDKKDFKDLLFMAIVNTVAGVLLSCAAATLISETLSTEERRLFSPFGIYYGLAFFSLSALITCKTYNIDAFDGYVNAMLVFICLSRLACVYAKCCGGSFPVVQTEIIFCCAALIYNAICKKIKYTSFYMGYSLFRFVVEFFKRTYKIEKIWLFTPLQYMAIIALAVTVLILLHRQRSKNEKGVD